MKHSHRIYQLLCTAISALTISCTTQITGVETTNGIRVTASSDNVAGIAPPNSQVYLCDSGYIPFVNRGNGLQTSADPNGEFQLPVSAGTWSVTVITPDGNVAGIVFDNLTASPATPEKASRTAGAPGTISGSLPATENDSLLVYLAGTCHYRLTTTDSRFTISYIPPGDYLLRVSTLSDGNGTPVTILHGQAVTITAGEAKQLGTLQFD